jgi:hypothetical protein
LAQFGPGPENATGGPFLSHGGVSQEFLQTWNFSLSRDFLAKALVETQSA